MGGPRRPAVIGRERGGVARNASEALRLDATRRPSVRVRRRGRRNRPSATSRRALECTPEARARDERERDFNRDRQIALTIQKPRGPDSSFSSMRRREKHPRVRSMHPPPPTADGPRGEGIPPAPRRAGRALADSSRAAPGATAHPAWRGTGLAMDPSLWGGAPLGAADERGVWSDAALLVSATHAKRWKDDLDRRGWLDRARRPASFPRTSSGVTGRGGVPRPRRARASRPTPPRTTPGCSRRVASAFPAVAAPTDRRAATTTAASPSTPLPSAPLPPPPPVPRDAPALPRAAPEPGTVARVPCPPDRDAFAERPRRRWRRRRRRRVVVVVAVPRPRLRPRTPRPPRRPHGRRPDALDPEFLAACPEADASSWTCTCPPTRAGGSDARRRTTRRLSPRRWTWRATARPGRDATSSSGRRPSASSFGASFGGRPGEASSLPEGALAPVIAPGEKYTPQRREASDENPGAPPGGVPVAGGDPREGRRDPPGGTASAVRRAKLPQHGPPGRLRGDRAVDALRHARQSSRAGRRAEDGDAVAAGGGAVSLRPGVELEGGLRARGGPRRSRRLRG